MKQCPICERKLPDDAFRSRQFKQPLPVCFVQCWPKWRAKSAEQAMMALSNQSQLGRKLDDMPIEPWQLRISDVDLKQSVRQNADIGDRIDSLVRQARDKKLPVNPRYQRRD